MTFRIHSMGAATVALICATLWLPALADGGPSAKHHARGGLTQAARKSNDSGVALQFRVDGIAQVGRPVAVYLQFDGVTDPAGATASFSSDAGLTLSRSEPLALPTGKSTAATLSVTSDREGLGYVNVFIRQGAAASAVSIPVQTGSAAPAMKPAGEMKSSPDGEKIISMPATEGK